MLFFYVGNVRWLGTSLILSYVSIDIDRLGVSASGISMYLREYLMRGSSGNV